MIIECYDDTCKFHSKTEPFCFEDTCKKEEEKVPAKLKPKKQTRV
jgi:hypothetical protein